MKISSSGKAALFVILAGFVVSPTACGQLYAPSADHSDFKKSKTLDDTHPRARLILGSRELVGVINISNLRFREVGKFTQAQVGIQNLSGVGHDLEYKVEWENADGFMIDQSGVWQRITLAPTQIYTVTTTSKMPESHKLVFTVRLPKSYFIDQNKTQNEQTN